jgi:hypothetical protein
VSRIRIWCDAKCWLVGLLLLAPAIPACSKDGEVASQDGGAAVKRRVAGARAPEPATEVAGDADAAEAPSGAVVPQDDFGRKKIVKTADLGTTSE